jgi:hypothetical protein
VQPALDIAGFAPEVARLTVAQDVAAIQVVDLALQIVDPDLQAANLAVVAIAIAVTLRLLRIILGGGRRCGNEGRSGKRGGNQELTHLALSLRTVDALLLELAA